MLKFLSILYTGGLLRGFRLRAASEWQDQIKLTDQCIVIARLTSSACDLASMAASK